MKVMFSVTPVPYKWSSPWRDTGSPESPIAIKVGGHLRMLKKAVLFKIAGDAESITLKNFEIQKDIS